MKHYFSIANFLIGNGVQRYDSVMGTTVVFDTSTFQPLLNQMNMWSRGNKGEVENLFSNGTIPNKFIDSWGIETAKIIANEFIYYINNAEQSNDWNGNVSIFTHSYIWELANNWSTATTITAGILDVINNNWSTITTIAADISDDLNHRNFFKQINNGDNMKDFKNAENLLNKYGYKNYPDDAELFLNHLKDGLKLSTYTYTDNYWLSKKLHMVHSDKTNAISSCEDLYGVFDKMGYNMLREVVQKQFFKTLERNDVLNVMKKMGELSKYISVGGFYHSKILELIDDYKESALKSSSENIKVKTDNNNNEKSSTTTPSFHCSTLVDELYEAGVPLTEQNYKKGTSLTYNIKSLLNADDTLSMLKNLDYPAKYYEQSYYTYFTTSESNKVALIKSALEKVGYEVGLGDQKALENFLEDLVQNNTTLKELNLTYIPKPQEFFEKSIDYYIGREHYQYVCVNPDKQHYDKCIELQDQFGIEFFGYEIEITN